MTNMDIHIPVERWQHFDLGKTTDLLLAEHPFLRFDRSVLFIMAEYLDYGFDQYIRDYLKRHKPIQLNKEQLRQDPLIEILVTDLEFQLEIFKQENPEYDYIDMTDPLDDLVYLLNGLVAIVRHHQIHVERLVAIEFENPATVAFVIRKPKGYIESMKNLERMLDGLKT